MNRIIINPRIGWLSLGALLVVLATACAAQDPTSTDSSEDELSSEGVRFVGMDHDGIARTSEATGTNAKHNAVPKSPQASCVGCGPLPDPWQNGPLPDPWTEPASSSSSSSSSSSGGQSSSGDSRRK